MAANERKELKKANLETKLDDNNLISEEVRHWIAKL
jgi:hypothetical protein